MNQTPSTPLLYLEILFIKMKTRIFDKRQPWWRPTPTWDKSDFLLTIWTKLLPWLYRDWKQLKPNKSKYTNVPHSMLRAFWLMTGGANSCYLPVRVSGLKTIPYSSRFSRQQLDRHISRWNFSHSQEGHSCLDYHLKCSSMCGMTRTII